MGREVTHEMCTRRSIHAGLLLLLAPTFSVSPVFAQEPTPQILTGIVIDEVTGQAIGGATVSVPSVGLRATTRDDGGFELTAPRGGSVQIRFQAERYMSVLEEVNLSEVAFLSVWLTPVQVALDEVLVITRRRPRSVTAGLSVVEEEASSKSALDVIEQEIPGISINRSGGLGSGAYIFLRGVTSFQQDLAPEVYLDGIRLDGSNTGTQDLHVLDAIPATAIARVRVLKPGSAAAASYPLGAPNGVIVIETHRGGPLRR